MNFLKVILLTVLFSLTFHSCSEDTSDDPENQEQIPFAGEVYSSEFVYIQTEVATADNYDATLNGTPIKVVDPGNELGDLMFFVDPAMVTIGGNDNILEIPALDLKLRYEVRETVLESSVAETLEPYFMAINSAEFDTSTAAGQNAQRFREGLLQMYQSLSQEEKRSIALFHQANSSLFNTAYSDLRSGRMPNENFDACLAATFLTGVFGGGAYLLANPATLVLSAISAGIAIVALIEAKEYCTAWVQGEIKHAFLKLDGIISDRSLEPSRMPDGIQFTSAEPKALSAVNVMRSLQSSDADDTNADISRFFSFVPRLNDYIVNTLNDIIIWYNDQVPFFAEVDPFQAPVDIPENGTEEPIPLEIASSFLFGFSVADSDVAIDYTMDQDGEIIFTMTIDENASEQEIETTLNYTYSDQFNDGVTGSFPITVTAQPLVGLWDMVLFHNGVPVGEYYDIYESDCPNILYGRETMSGNFTFNADNTFSYSWTTIQIVYNIQYDSDCEIVGDSENVTYNDVETGTGTYSFNGNNYILDYDEGGTETVQFLEQDRIKIFEEEYVRQ